MSQVCKGLYPLNVQPSSDSNAWVSRSRDSPETFSAISFSSQKFVSLYW